MIVVVLACYAFLTLLMLMPAFIHSRSTGIGNILIMFLLWVWFAGMATLPFVLLG